MKQGLSLLELLVVLVIIGLMAGAAAPAIGGLRDRYVVAAVAADLVGAHNRARIHAVMNSRVTDLQIGPDSLVIQVSAGISGPAIWRAPGPASSGVTLAPPPRTLSFAPTGITLGFANATFVLTKGTARRQVVVSRLGRVRVIP